MTILIAKKQCDFDILVHSQGLGNCIIILISYFYYVMTSFDSTLLARTLERRNDNNSA